MKVALQDAVGPALSPEQHGIVQAAKSGAARPGWKETPWMEIKVLNHKIAS
jgi:hypothetical protein